MRTRGVLRGCGLFLAATLTATLVQVTVLPATAVAAGGPSVPSPSVPSVPVTQQGRGAPASADETASRALQGDQSGGGSTRPGSGNFTATSLGASATWQVSGQTGDFQWSYPISAPPAPGGLIPAISLSYSSGAVDGLTSATNNQASWVGDGWSLWPGFVERGYRGCPDDLEGEGEEPGDLCWHTDNATLSLNGANTELIRDDTTGVWKPKDDDGSRVERVTTAGNGDDNGESWKITTVDGTQYFFGSTPTAKSTWTVPVFGDDVNEPCHQATFAASGCTQAYRWNLDKVVDRYGNMMRYVYQTETNFYGRNKNSAAAEYVRGGWLERVDYGLRADNASIAASGQIAFDVADRCVPGSDCTLTKPANLPDVPLNLKCDGGSCVDKWSPTFWSTKRLAKITTKVRSGTAYVPVDSWTLRHILPDPGDGEKPALWLKGITHTGHTGTPITLPEVTFDGVRKPNRVYATNGDGYASLIRFRMNAIVSEAGGVTSIGYAEPECVHGSRMPANPETNAMRCFPVRWNPPRSPERTDYFHKYVVESVKAYDGLAGTLADETSYEYLGGAAWHWDTSEFTPEDKKTWNEFRGYARVRIRKGSGHDSPKTMTEQRFYRGMNGDKLPSGTRSVTVADTEGGVRTDSEWLRGSLLESATFEREAASSQADPPRITKAIITPVAHGPTASRGTRSARIVRTAQERVFTRLESGSQRETRVDTTYDQKYGLPTAVNDLGEVTDDADDLCTRTTYVPNTGAAWLVNFPSRIETVSVRCEQAPVFPDDAVSDVRSSYDGQGAGVAPIYGNVTRNEIASTRPASGPVYVTQATSTYDKHGRLRTATDPLGKTTTTVYTPAEGGPLTQVVSTTPPTPAVAAGLVTTTTVDPRRGLPTATVDPNGRRTEIAYDALGRSTEVWLPNRRRVTYADGNIKFSYQVRNNAPNVVTTTKIGPNGTYTRLNQLYDGLLRARQTQTDAVGGGRLITDTWYDSQGRAYRAMQPFYNAGAVDTNLWLTTDQNVPALTETEYDGAGRAAAQVFKGEGDEKWRTTIRYGGDRVHVTPPEGGTATTSISDARGRTVELRTYQAPTPTGDFDTTSYTYTPAGQLATLKDPGGNTWSYTYDLRGRQVQSVDPDRGTATMTYDNADQLATTRDARGVTLAHSYDSLGRKTGTYRDRIGGTKLAEWVYDTAFSGKGYLASSTRWVGTSAYTASVYSYTALYQPSETTVTIPAAERELAGEYTSTFSYDWDGSLSGEVYPAAGELIEEAVNYQLDDWGRPLTSSGAAAGTVELVTDTRYTRYGELERVQLGEGTKNAWLSYYYDDHTRQLKRAVVDAELSSPMQVDTGYTYDDAGNITSISGTAAGQSVDRQCFRYDHLRRLTEAWTPSVECASDPAATALAGPAPYWHSYGYDTVGNRTKETRHAAGGVATRTYDYTGHALDKVVAQDPGGSSLEEFDYDLAGNTTRRVDAGEGQTLEWDAEGHLSKVTDDTGAETSFLYTAEGDRLIRRDPDAVTLYLGNQEIRLDRATKVKKGTRYYQHGGLQIAVRTGAGLSWLAGDHNGTGSVAITSDTLQVSHRRQLPFGEPRGGSPVFWPGQRGFVGGVDDESTGLTHLGAREYEPELGRFISVDPIMDLANSQQLNGYTYSNNNPVTFADPSGLYCDSCDFYGEGIAGAGPGCQAYSSGTCGPGPSAQEQWDVSQGRNKNPSKQPRIGGKRVPTFDEIKQLPRLGHYLEGGSYKDAVRDWARETCMGPQTDEEFCSAASDAGMLEQSIDFGDIFGFLYELTPVSDAVNCVSGQESCVWFAVSLFPGSKVFKALDNVGDLSRAAKGADAPKSAKKSCSVSSFVPGTEVLMADGTTKPIEDVEVGDQVRATDPHTGETGSRPVVATITTQGTKNLVELTIDTDGRAGEATATLTATANHPFWADDQDRWIEAGDLRADADLRTTRASVGLVDGRSEQGYRRVHNLTVEGIHTYYVIADNTSVLVHNTPCGTDVVRYDPDFALGQLTQGRVAKASELDSFDASQGWTRSRTTNGPIKYTDESGTVRVTIKRVSGRAPGSGSPHVEMRNSAGERVDPYGNAVTRKSPGNHTPVEHDSP
jgi:RHS repeat-associated protein